MKILKMKNSLNYMIRLFIFIILLESIHLSEPIYAFAATDDEKKEVTICIEQIFQRRNKACF